MLPPELTGKYDLLGTLGSGAMGTVFEAMDRRIERRVAIKVVRRPAPGDADAEDAHARFRREAQAAGRLSHPNIVGVFDFGEDADNAWIVMELVDGGSLKDRFDRGERFPVPEIVRLFEQICAALTYSHGRGVVHRDIKPANLMLTGDADGSVGDIKIADYGIARLENSSMTQLGTMMGTPSYMAPEQLRGETVDARADIWAAGVVLYQLLTGEKPFEGGFSAVMHKALHTEPAAPSRLSVTAPVAFDVVIARALAKRPEDRFANAADFGAGIRAAVQAPIAPREVDPLADPDATFVSAAPRPRTAAPPLPVAGPPAVIARRRPPVALFAGGAVAAVAAAGAAVWFGASGPSAPPTPMAQTSTSGPEGRMAPVAPPVPLASPPLGVATAPPPGATPAAPASAPGGSPVATPTPTGPSFGLPATSPPAGLPAIATAPTTAPPAAPPPGPIAAIAPPPAPEIAARDADAGRRGEQAAAERDAATRRVAWRDAAVAASSVTPCALLSWSADESGVSLAGPVRRGGEALARQTLTGAGVPAAATRVTPDLFDGPDLFCNLLATIRDHAAGPSAPPLVVIGGAQPLARGELLKLTIEMPAEPSHLAVAYLMQSGDVAHLVPSRSEAASASVRLGEPTGTFPGWEVDAPFGTDLVLILASDRPLLPGRRPQVEPGGAWLAALGAALRTARAQGARISARVQVVETVAAR